MNDPILDRYRKVAEQGNEERRAKVEENEQERLRLLETIPSEVEQAFERLERINYVDEMTKGMIRSVKTESSDTAELVTWALGQTNYRVNERDNNDVESMFIGSNRSFYATDTARPYGRDYPLNPLDPSRLKLDEVQRLVGGLRYVGKRR